MSCKRCNNIKYRCTTYFNTPPRSLSGIRGVILFSWERGYSEKSYFLFLNFFRESLINGRTKVNGKHLNPYPTTIPNCNPNPNPNPTPNPTSNPTPNPASNPTLNLKRFAICLRSLNALLPLIERCDIMSNTFCRKNKACSLFLHAKTSQAPLLHRCFRLKLNYRLGEI